MKKAEFVKVGMDQMMQEAEKGLTEQGTTGMAGNRVL
jgi:hypothetical protein